MENMEEGGRRNGGNEGNRESGALRMRKLKSLHLITRSPNISDDQLLRAVSGVVRWKNVGKETLAL